MKKQDEILEKGISKQKSEEGVKEDWTEWQKQCEQMAKGYWECEWSIFCKM